MKEIVKLKRGSEVRIAQKGGYHYYESLRLGFVEFTDEPKKPKKAKKQAESENEKEQKENENVTND